MPAPRGRTAPGGPAATRARTRRHRPPPPARVRPSSPPESRARSLRQCVVTRDDTLASIRRVALGVDPPGRLAGPRGPVGMENAKVAPDDGPADRETDPHSAVLRGVERVEQAGGAGRVEPAAGILHRQADPAV